MITNDNDWIDLKIGDRAPVRGKLESVGADILIVQFADWSRLLIDAPASVHRLESLIGQDIELEIIRTEDGVATDVRAIALCLHQLGRKSSAPVYLHLFHGRTDPKQDMDDWGSEGPSIGPLDYVHCTYMCDVKFAMPYEVAEKFFPDVAARDPDNGYPVDHHINMVDDLLLYGGVYYGDWSVSTEAGQ